MSTRLAEILQLHRNMPWIGDRLSAADTSRILRAYSSMAVAFAIAQGLDADRLVNILAIALGAQRDDVPQVGIDEGAEAILKTLGEW